MGQQHVIIAVSMASTLLFASKTYGRIGENYSQCVARYGKAVAALPGLGHILGVAGFEKSGIAVTALFDRQNKQCFLIMYLSKREVDSESNNIFTSVNAVLSEAEIDSLMASINTTWMPIEEEQIPMSANYGYRHVGPSDPIRIGGFVSGKAIQSRDKDISLIRKVPAKKVDKNVDLEKALSAAKAFADALKEGQIAHLYARDEKCQAIFDSLPPTTWLTPYRGSGNHLFAFKVGYGCCNGLLLINSYAAKEILDWAEAYIESLKKEKDKGRPLEGF